MKPWHYVALGFLAYYIAVIGRSGVRNWGGVTSI